MSTATGPNRTQHVEHVMGTVASFDVRGAAPSLAHAAIARACAELHRIDRVFSTYRPDSAICRIDRGELPLVEAADEVQAILARCERLRAQSGGAFDARATGSLDPSALVKGWAGQVVSEQLRHEGLADHCINLGGDVVCAGAAAPLDHWRVGVQHPRDPAALAAVVALHGGGAVATSGSYERGAHIATLADRRGRATVPPLSVTVTGPELALADAYSTAAFAMGEDGPVWTTTLDGYESLTIFADGRVLQTRDFPLARTPAVDARFDDRRRAAA